MWLKVNSSKDFKIIRFTKGKIITNIVARISKNVVRMGRLVKQVGVRADISNKDTISIHSSKDSITILTTNHRLVTNPILKSQT